MQSHLLERFSPAKVAIVGGIFAIAGSLGLTFLSIALIGMEQMTLSLVAMVAILCPGLIAPPTIYQLCKAHRKVVRQRQELASANRKLTQALNQVKEMSGLLPVCSWCHKVRDDTGYWEKVEAFIERNTQTTITHGVCPECKTRELAKLRESSR